MPDRSDPRPYPVPDLAVEVRSPSTWRYDIGRPLVMWLARHVGPPGAG